MRPEATLPRHPHRLDRDFRPLACPDAECPSRAGSTSFRYCKRGKFTRAVDLRTVQRFQCLVCRRYFSSQTFRVDYRYHRPRLHIALFQRLAAKCSLRQAARELCCHPDSLLLRLARLGPHARWFNDAFLDRHRRERGGILGSVQLDELETFETARRIFPVTVPVLVHKESRFIVHVAADTLPARGNLRGADLARLARAEAKFGQRRNRSRVVVTECFRTWKRVASDHTPLVVWTDCKLSYPPILKQVLGRRVVHLRVHSKEPRGVQNPLFPVNHTLAMLRDGVGRLVRRSWCHAKLRRNLEWHLWIWALYRNYVRELTNKRRWRSSAQALGIVNRRLGADEILAWTDRIPSAA